MPSGSPTGRVRLYRHDGRLDGFAVEIQGVLPHPPEAVFAALTEPDRIRTHPGVSELIVVQPGTDVAHGPGAVRDVTLPVGRFRERVVSWDPPHHIEYAVDEASVPIEHHGGSIGLAAVPEGTAVAWTSSFSVRMGIASLPVAWWAAHRMADHLAWHLEAVGFALSGVDLPRPRPGPRLAWALLPVALWNMAFASSLPPWIGSDEGVPLALLGAEHALRVAAVVAAVFVRVHPRATRVEQTAVLAGIAVYFASWLPLLFDLQMATQPSIALGPAVTPALFLAPLARVGRSWVFGGLAAAFLATHIAHQMW